MCPARSTALGAGVSLFNDKCVPQKSPPETAKTRRDENGPGPVGEIPAKTTYLDSTCKPMVRKDWVVVCAVRYEPVSGGNSLLTGKLTGNFAILGPQKPISLHETTVLQRLFTKFPTQINRENILKNREFLSGNREFHLQNGKRPFLTHLFGGSRTRSVLILNLQMRGGRDDGREPASRSVRRGLLAGAP